MTEPPISATEAVRRCLPPVGTTFRVGGVLAAARDLVPHLRPGTVDQALREIVQDVGPATQRRPIVRIDRGIYRVDVEVND